MSVRSDLHDHAAIVAILALLFRCEEQIAERVAHNARRTVEVILDEHAEFPSPRRLEHVAMQLPACIPRPLCRYSEAVVGVEEDAGRRIEALLGGLDGS